MGSDDAPDFNVTIIPQSLGNRVDASVCKGLQTSFVPFANAGQFLGKMRHVLAHPALRRPDLSRLKLKGNEDFPVAALQEEFKGSQRSMMFFSPEDKTGLAFLKAQGEQMLGRESIPPDYAEGNNKYPFKLKDFIANQGNQFRDVWHVTLFGQVLPGTLEYSRPIYEFNREGPGGLRGAAKAHHHLVQYQDQHLDLIWDWIEAYVKTGHRPGDPP